MINYEEIRDEIEDLSRLTLLADGRKEVLLEVGYPAEYIEFLGKIGYGNLGSIQLYSAPVQSDSIYAISKSDLGGIVLFGDDHQGYCYGFDTGQAMGVVVVNPRGEVEQTVNGGFDTIINNHLGRLED
jgi:hypothetical protein